MRLMEAPGRHDEERCDGENVLRLLGFTTRLATERDDEWRFACIEPRTRGERIAICCLQKDVNRWKTKTKDQMWSL